MNKKHILGIGISGLVGSRVQELLEPKYAFTGLSRETNFDITNPDTVSFSSHPDAEYVIQFAAKADVDSCELDKEQGKDGEAWKINVDGTTHVIEACLQANKKLIYISTDFVFSGDDTPSGGYTEESTPHPINWYGETKYQAEELIKKSGLEYLIVRPAYPYRAQFDVKKDFVRAILGRLQNNQPIKAITDHYYSPTFIDDIALALDTLIQQGATGIYHVVGSETLTPYDASMAIARVFECNQNLIGKTTREEYFAGKAPRPFNLSLNNDRIHKFGVNMHGFHEGLLQMKAQMAI